MSFLFGKKDLQKQAETEQKHREIADQFDGMVREALSRLTGWAFPGSSVESAGIGKWELIHTTAEGGRIVDMTVTLHFKKDRPVALMADHSSEGRSTSFGTITMTRESLDDALRRCLSGR